MKKFILILVFLSLLSCVETGKHYYGLSDTSAAREGVTYKISTNNIVLGIVLIETIIVPVVIALDYLYESVDVVN